MSATIAARARPAPTISAPAVRRPAKARAPRSSWYARMGRNALRKPGRALVFVLFAAVTGMILVNALMLQRARHPAPILSAPSQVVAPRHAERRAEPVQTSPMQASPAQTSPAQPASPQTSPAYEAQPYAPPAALPPARPSGLDREAVSRPPASVPAAQRQAQAPAAAPARPAAPPPARDPIADLLNGGDLRPPGEIRGAAPRR